MKEITCNTILDILPLYADGVISEDTAEMVQDHLDGCKSCQRALDAMQSDMTLPIDLGPSSLRKYRTKRKHRKITIVCCSMVGAVLALFAFVYFGVWAGVPISSEDVILTTQFEDFYPSTSQDADTLYLNQVWHLNIRSKDGRPLIHSAAGTENGQEITVTQLFRFKKDQLDNTDVYMPYPSEYPVADDHDYIVTLKFSDKTIAYSMRDEGLFEPQETAPLTWR